MCQHALQYACEVPFLHPKINENARINYITHAIAKKYQLWGYHVLYPNFGDSGIRL